MQYTARSRRLAENAVSFRGRGVARFADSTRGVIRGRFQHMVEGLVKDPAAIERYAKRILRNAEELTSMIENVLAFSASLHSDNQEAPQVFAISGDLLEHAASSMAQEIEQAGSRIELAVAPDLPAVAGDAVAHKLVYLNLIANAERHDAAGNWILVTASRLADCLDIRVCDRGPGVRET